MTVIYNSEETFWCIHSHYPSHTVSKSTELKMLPVDVNHLPVPSLHVQYIQLLPSAAAEGQARAHMFSMLWISPIVSKQGLRASCSQCISTAWVGTCTHMHTYRNMCNMCICIYTLMCTNKCMLIHTCRECSYTYLHIHTYSHSSSHLHMHLHM